MGGWSKDKYFYIGRYIDMFTKSMKGKWNLYYIDLFSGCGRCRVRETEEEIDGSALLALNTKYKFKKYFFIDLDPLALNALKKRIKAIRLSNMSELIEGDCNEKN